MSFWLEVVPPEAKTNRKSFWIVFFGTGFFLSCLASKCLPFVQHKHRIIDRLIGEHGRAGGGLIGSILGIATFLILPKVVANFPVTVAVGLAAAIWVSHQTEKILNTHDDPRIIIDEWIGAWIACWGLGHSIGLPVFLALLFFRIFDVKKGPWGRKLQNLPGGYGVVLDDVFAGLVANAITRFLLVVVFTYSG